MSTARKIQPTGQGPEESECLWRADDAARFLGVSRRLVYLMAQEGVLPSVRFGSEFKRGAVAFDPVELRRFRASRARRSARILNED